MENSYLCSLYETSALTFYAENENRLGSLNDGDGLAAVFYEKIYYEFIRKNIYSSFYITSELKDIIANDFKTKEQKYVEEQLHETKKQTKRAGYSVIISGIALFAAIISIIISIITVSSGNDRLSQNEKTKIQNQENEIIKEPKLPVDSTDIDNTNDSIKK